MAENIVIYDNVKERALDLLLGQFVGKQNWKKFIEIITGPLQELEYVFADLLLKVSLDSSFGAQLDQIGEIVGADRGSLDDDDYRNLLRFQIALNRSAGEAEFLMSALILLTEATRVQLIEEFPAAISLITNGTVIPPLLAEKMDELAAGGVQVIYVAPVPEIPFTFDSETSESYGLGYAWIDGSGELDGSGAGGYAWAVP